MLIDWFTVFAQAINFLILVWLLKRFLYKPILRAIDEREKGIAVQLAEAEAKQAEAQKERNAFQNKNEAFEREHAALLKTATDEARAERQRLLDEARKEADALRAKRQEALRNEYRTLSREIAGRTQKEVFAIARKTLADLAATSIEERISEVFVQRLRALDATAKAQLAGALKASTQPARVRSAFDLPAAQRSAIEDAVKKTFAANAQLQFETAPELVSGIELSANGQKVAWSIADYLAALEKSAGELLREDFEPDSRQDAKAKLTAETQPNTGQKREPKQEIQPVPSAPRAEH